MADKRFFKNSGSKTLKEIVDISGAKPLGKINENLKIIDVAPLDVAGENDVSFLDNVKYKDDFKNTNAGACFVTEELAYLAPVGTIPLISLTPYKSFALTSQSFYPDIYPEPNVSDSAIIGENSNIGKGSYISAGVVIGENVEIGEGCYIEPNAVIMDGVILGDKCRIGANTTISHSIIGHNVRIYPGVKIGQDGFGFAIDVAGHVKVPQLGRVIIEDSVEIGANTTIDRGAGPDTVIGQGTWIDNLVQIGHNVKIGKGCVIVAQAGVSGSTILEDYVVLAGQVGIAGHLKIGAGARIAAQSGIMRDVGMGQEMMGYPAVPIKQFMKQVAILRKMTKTNK